MYNPANEELEKAFYEALNNSLKIQHLDTTHSREFGLWVVLHLLLLSSSRNPVLLLDIEHFLTILLQVPIAPETVLFGASV